MRALLRELGRMGRTVLISSHVLTDLAGLCDRYLVLELGEVVFAGSPDELVRRAGAEPRIEIDIPRRALEATDFLGRHSAVRIARATAEGCEIVLADEGSAPEAISRALHEAGFEIARFAPRVVDLEEAFLRLTKGSIA
jgi:ABC-2 type transport system ATP-binding protein